ncbi:Enoyl-CoA hydratase/isomerase [Catenulispora acidiphila DSM 44928]|uniref:Enoyl-CoA hydratase/isomerase n=1 Tax=Catenulispora acidiphila (strain DSM 44928 / JCM 14897 / NBRC 102108 / NRRL B-24433 / ID139908) TaxID=479433 RepID=C7Q231_CATAD|nr:enoyl-CoA hydratase-related protein [Catenulispora acidiphila]ACU77568.1 Enoyl-CoA hydratase/isomerase [Catenulispora acidiphila DSM 44928]
MPEVQERPLDETVRHSLSGGVAWITLDRPEALNAITADHRDRLIALLRQASADPQTRVVVLTATGRGFCTGADLRPRPGAAPAAEPRPGDVARTIRDGAQALVAAVLDCEKPVIGAVNGIAAGIGAHLALACDLVIAAESAKFIEVFARRGLVPDGGGAHLLTRLVGVHKAKELMFFADDVPAAEALALGLVNRVVPDADLEKAARAWAERLAVGPTRALALAKNLVNRALEVDRATAFREEADAVELNMATHDGQEGVRAFVERRAPEFTGS